MTIELLAFIFGIVLLFIAIVGGGFELRELKVPRVGRVARIVSAVAGVIFLALGFSGSSVSKSAEPPPASQTPAPTAPPPSPDPVYFAVHDELGELQITEQVTVHIDGRMVGTLTVDTVHPSSEVAVTLPEAGRYDYVLRSTTVFDHDGEPVEVPGYGSGQIDVKDGSSFSVVAEVGEQELLLALE
jgi:hypothetical protein